MYDLFDIQKSFVYYIFIFAGAVISTDMDDDIIGFLLKVKN